MKIVSADGNTLPAGAEKEYESAPEFDRLRIGDTGVFFPSGLKTKYIPYGCFDRSYVKVHDAQARMCCATAGFEYYRIVFMSGEKCIGDFISEDREAMQAALDRLRTAAPGIRIGVRE